MEFVSDASQFVKTLRDKLIARKELTEEEKRFVKNNFHLVMNSFSSLPELVRYVKTIEDFEKRKQFIDSLREPIRMYVRDAHARLLGSDEEKKEWNSGVIDISDITQLDLRQLSTMPNDIMIRISGNHVGAWQRQLYSRETYRDILLRIEELFKDVPCAKKGDIESELDTFFKVASVISRFDYDEDCDKSIPSVVSSRNLEGGILHGKCVCEGYAEILRNVLILKGIDSRFIKATDPVAATTHSWNQVKIGDHWFNVDITWDRDFICGLLDKGEPLPLDLLMSDEEASGHKRYTKYRHGEEKCDLSFEEYQRQLKKKSIDGREM